MVQVYLIYRSLIILNSFFTIIMMNNRNSFAINNRTRPNLTHAAKEDEFLFYGHGLLGIDSIVTHFIIRHQNKVRKKKVQKRR